MRGEVAGRWCCALRTWDAGGELADDEEHEAGHSSGSGGAGAGSGEKALSESEDGERSRHLRLNSSSTLKFVAQM